MREHQERALGGHGRADDEDVENQNVQSIKLISALGSRHSGRQAIFAAMAAKQEVASDQKIDNLMSGKAEFKCQPT